MPNDHIGIKFSKINFLWKKMCAPKIEMKKKISLMSFQQKIQKNVPTFL